MVAPERNLPPDAQAWGRYVEKQIADLKKTLGVTSTNLRATAARTASAAARTATVASTVEQVVENVQDTAEEVANRPVSVWTPTAPENPKHGDRWNDNTNGNVQKIWVDYGLTERINYVRNPTFRGTLSGWTATDGTLTVSVEDKARLTTGANSHARIIETVGRQVYIDLPAQDNDEDGEAGSPAASVPAPWTASAEVSLVGTASSADVTLMVVYGEENVACASSGIVRLDSGVPTRITTSMVEDPPDDSVRVCLIVSSVGNEIAEVLADDVILETTTYTEGQIPHYFDGSLPGALWQGTENLSTSWWDGVPRWVEAQDLKLKEEIRQEANEAIENVRKAFTTTNRPPTPADGADKPEGAYWTEVNDDNEQVGRWRWLDGMWVSTPIAVEFIPEAYIDYLVANEAFISQLTLASEIDGWITQVSGRGLETFRPDGVAAIQLGNFGENYLQLSTAEDVVGVALDQSGGVNAINGSFNDSLRYRGVELDERLRANSEVVAWGGAGAGQFSILTSPGGERALFELAGDNLTDERRYWEFTTSNILLRVHAPGDVGLRLRFTNDGSTPGFGSEVLAYDQQTVTKADGGFVTCSIPYRPFIMPPGASIRAFVSMFSNGPGIEVEKATGNTVWGRLVDHGPLKEQSIVLRSDYILRDAPVPTPTPTPAKKRYVNDTLGRAWHKVWEQGGGSPAAIQGSVIQGRTPYYPSAGIYRSMVGFPSLTGMLSGAEIESIQVQIRAEHWYANAGGRVDIGLHGAASAPGGFSEMVHGVASARLGIGGSTWITIPRAYYAGFRNGTYRGITVFRNSADPVDYGKFTPSWFRIRATYVK